MRFRLFAKDVECARVSVVLLVVVLVVLLLSRMMSSLRSLCISSSKKYSIYIHVVSMEVKCTTFKVYLVVMEIHRRRVL